MSHDILLILFCVTSHFSTWHAAVWNRCFEMNVFGLLRLALSLWDHSVEELTESNSTNSPVGKGSMESLPLLGRTVYCWVELEVIALVLFCFVLHYCLHCAGTWHVTSLVFQDWGKDSTRVQVSGIAGQLLWYAAEENAAQQEAHFGRCWEETQGCCKRLFSLSLQCFFSVISNYQILYWFCWGEGGACLGVWWWLPFKALIALLLDFILTVSVQIYSSLMSKQLYAWHWWWCLPVQS